MSDFCYLKTSVVLVFFFICVILYLKYSYQPASTFKELSEPDTILFETGPPVKEPLPVIQPEPNIYLLDSRYQYSDLPPVNVNVKGTMYETSIPAEYDLYTNQPYTNNTLLDIPPAANTNQLVYSGGNTQMLSIPLQMNDPYPEALRTQDVLITPYNKIKYGNC